MMYPILKNNFHVAQEITKFMPVEDLIGSNASTGGSQFMLNKCKCGHDRTHYLVSAKCKYTFAGWLWVTLVGVTTRPLKIDYQCRRCEQIFDTSQEPEDLDSLA